MASARSRRVMARWRSWTSWADSVVATASTAAKSKKRGDITRYQPPQYSTAGLETDLGKDGASFAAWVGCAGDGPADDDMRGAGGDGGGGSDDSGLIGGI